MDDILCPYCKQSLMLLVSIKQKICCECCKKFDWELNELGEDNERKR